MEDRLCRPPRGQGVFFLGAGLVQATIRLALTICLNMT